MEESASRPLVAAQGLDSLVRIEMLGNCATKNFRGHIRTRDQKHNLGIGVIGWGLKERRRRRCTGSFRNYVLVE